MAKERTNLMEIILRDVLMNMVIYDTDDQGNEVQITIGDLNYDPSINAVFIEDSITGNRYKFALNDYFDFDYQQVKVIDSPSKKIRRKNKKK